MADDSAIKDPAVDALPEMLRPIAVWIQQQYARGGIVGINADTGAFVPESMGAYYHAWQLIRDLEAELARKGLS